MRLDSPVPDRSPRKQPIVAQAINDIYNIHPILKRELSTNDTADRITQQLETFLSQYTDHFLRFVEQEQRLKEDEAAVEEQRRLAAASSGSTPARKQLRRMVAPLLGLENRLKEAMEQAHDDVMAVYDMEDVSQSLGSRKGGVISGVPPTPPDDNSDRSSAPKRGSSETSNEEESGITKRSRIVASGTVTSGLHARRATPRESSTVIIIPDSPPTPMQNLLPETTPKTPAHAVVQRQSASSRKLADEIALRTGPQPRTGSEGVNGKNSEASRKRSPRYREPDERYLLVTSKHRWQAYMNKHIPFHTQWELEHHISRSPYITMADVSSNDLEVLNGPPTMSGPQVADVIRQAEQRVRLAERSKRQFLRTNTSTMSVNLAQPLSATADWEAQKIRKEAEMEDRDIATGSMAGMRSGPVDRQRPYGASPTNIYRTKASSKQMDVAGLSCKLSMADPDNPFDTDTRRRDTTFPFAMVMQPPRMGGKSFRLTRAFASRRIISFKISKKLKKDKFKVRDMLLGRVLLVLGRTYRAFWATPEGENVFAVETGDQMPSGWRRQLDERNMPSFMDMMARFNDPRLKPGQAMAKWAARPQLLFSDTVPVCHVDPSAATVIADVIASSARDPNNITAEEILTDGCGLMSRKLARTVRSYSQLIGLAPLTRDPSAIQIRCGGAKGLLTLMSDEQEAMYAGKDIVLRQSMVKSYAAPEFASERSMLTLDLVQHSSTACKLGTSLSAEPMTIMHAQGVRRSTFVALQKAKLDEIGQMLQPVPQATEETGCMENEAQMLSRLRRNVYALGGVGIDRKKRKLLAQGTSLKVAGLRGRMAGSDEVEEEEELWANEWGCDSDEEEAMSEISGLSRSSSVIKANSSAAYEINALNGMPASPAEALYEALSSGFTPAESPFVRDKLRAVVHRLADSIVRTFKIPLERSLTAFIVPDPTGLLAPHEIFISLSQPFTDPETGMSTLSILGPVLALRSPCKLPTDVQKMQAVFVPQLAHLTDVIVMSADAARCSRSPASMLGGGDYDGDTVQIIWEPQLVERFRNADPALADTPEGFIEDNFEKELVTVQEELDASDNMSGEAGIVSMQWYLLGGIEGDLLTGKYSELHGNAVYELGISHPETFRLARMFCHVLDARKSGLTVKKAVLQQDSSNWAGKLDWRDFKKGRSAGEYDDRLKRKRGRGMGTFILDELQQQGTAHAKAVLSTFAKSDTLNIASELQDLASPWHDLLASIDTLCSSMSRSDAPYCVVGAIKRDIAIVERHVCAVIKTYEALRCNPDPGLFESLYNQHVASSGPTFALDLTDEPDWDNCLGSEDVLDLSRPASRIDTILAPRVDSPRSVIGTPTRRPRKPDQYRTKEEKKRASRYRKEVEDRVLRIWHNRLTPVSVPGVLIGYKGDNAQMRLRELMLARAAKEGKWSKHLNFLFEMDFEMTCSIKARSGGGACEGQGTVSRAVVRRRDAWEESKPSTKRARAG